MQADNFAEHFLLSKTKQNTDSKMVCIMYTCTLYMYVLHGVLAGNFIAVSKILFVLTLCLLCAKAESMKLGGCYIVLVHVHVCKCM